MIATARNLVKLSLVRKNIVPLIYFILIEITSINFFDKENPMASFKLTFLYF